MKVESVGKFIFGGVNVSLFQCRYFERVSANRLEKIFADSAPVLFLLINVLGICIWQFVCSSDPFVSLSALVVEVFFFLFFLGNLPCDGDDGRK